MVYWGWLSQGLVRSATEVAMTQSESVVKSLWYSVVMSFVSLGMFAEYTRLVLTTDDSLRRMIVLAVWGVIAIAWIAVAAVRIRKRRSAT